MATNFRNRNENFSSGMMTSINLTERFSNVVEAGPKGSDHAEIDHMLCNSCRDKKVYHNRAMSLAKANLVLNKRAFLSLLPSILFS